jgi:hypothetical protein
MDNELIAQSWWQRNWKWLITIVLIATGIALLLSFLANDSDFAKAYANPALYDNALQQAQNNARVKEALGTLKPLDRMAIIEGNIIYVNEDRHVDITVPVKGDKGDAKLDITADKDGSTWKYSLIKIRIKEPKQEIIIVGDTVG